MNPNIFSAEQPIIDKLKEILDPLFPGIAIGSASMIASADDIAAFTPGVFVFAGSGEVNTDAVKHTVTADKQRWQISVFVKNHVGTDTSSAFRAGEILAAVFDAMLGWAPTEYHKPLKLTGRADPYYEPGYAEFPVFFETTLVQKRS